MKKKKFESVYEKIKRDGISGSLGKLDIDRLGILSDYIETTLQEPVSQSTINLERYLGIGNGKIKNISIPDLIKSSGQIQFLRLHRDEIHWGSVPYSAGFFKSDVRRVLEKLPTDIMTWLVQNVQIFRDFWKDDISVWNAFYSSIFRYETIKEILGPDSIKNISLSHENIIGFNNQEIIMDTLKGIYESRKEECVRNNILEPETIEYVIKNCTQKIVNPCIRYQTIPLDLMEQLINEKPSSLWPMVRYQDVPESIISGYWYGDDGIQNYLDQVLQNKKIHLSDEFLEDYIIPSVPDSLLTILENSKGTVDGFLESHWDKIKDVVSPKLLLYSEYPITSEFLDRHWDYFKEFIKITGLRYNMILDQEWLDSKWDQVGHKDNFLIYGDYEIDLITRNSKREDEFNRIMRDEYYKENNDI